MSPSCNDNYIVYFLIFMYYNIYTANGFIFCEHHASIWFYQKLANVNYNYYRSNFKHSLIDSNHLQRQCGRHVHISDRMA